MPPTIMQEAVNQEEDRGGRGWRIAAWSALGASALGWLLFPALHTDGWDLDRMLHRLAMSVTFILAPAVTAAVCAFQGAALSAAKGDRRPAVMLPVWASCAFFALLLLSLIT
jgi:hypothetical protein